MEPPCRSIAADSNGGIAYTEDVDQNVNGINVVTIDNGTLYIYVR